MACASEEAYEDLDVQVASSSALVAWGGRACPLELESEKAEEAKPHGPNMSISEFKSK